MLVPGLNIVMLCMFAFKEWPVQRELALTRQALQAATGSPYPQGGHQQYTAPTHSRQGGYGQPPTSPYGNSY